MDIKKLLEEATCASLGPAPCPTATSGCTVNGVAVTGKSVKTNKVNDDIEKEIKKLLDENFNERYDEITEYIAKQLDRLNFDFANTDDIIYKKEGSYKYLVRFDNEIGLLKFKITKDDKDIVVKEWQLETEDDVTEAFKEIEAEYNKYGI